MEKHSIKLIKKGIQLKIFFLVILFLTIQFLFSSLIFFVAINKKSKEKKLELSFSLIRELSVQFQQSVIVLGDFSLKDRLKSIEKEFSFKAVAIIDLEGKVLVSSRDIYLNIRKNQNLSDIFSTTILRQKNQKINDTIDILQPCHFEFRLNKHEKPVFKRTRGFILIRFDYKETVWEQFIRFSFWFSIVVLVMMLLILAAGIVIFSLSQKIFEFLQTVRNAVISGNDMYRPIPLPSQTEFKILAKMFNSVFEELAQYKSKGKQSFSKIFSTTMKLSDLSKSISSEGQQQVSMIGETHSAMSNLTETSKSIELHVQDVAKIANETKINTSNARKAMQLIFNNIAFLNNEIIEINEMISSFSQSIEQIHKIVEMINEFTDQTKIIAFNVALETVSLSTISQNLELNNDTRTEKVAIISRRFSVVTKEILNLAGNIENSSAKIKNLISDILETVSGIKISVANTTADVKKSELNSKEGEEAFKQIVTLIERTALLSQQISRRTSEEFITQDTIFQELDRIVGNSEKFLKKSNELRNIVDELHYHTIMWKA